MGSVEVVNNQASVKCSCGNEIINKIKTPQEGDKCMSCRLKVEGGVACKKKINW